MRQVGRLAAAGLLVGLMVALGACAQVTDMMGNAYNDDGSVTGTVPGHEGETSGPMYNGIMPEPWNDTP